MKSVSLKEISESVVFHFCVLFIFPDTQMQVQKKHFSSKYELSKIKKEYTQLEQHLFQSLHNARIQVGKLSELKQGSVFLKCEGSVLVEKYYTLMGFMPKGNSVKEDFLLYQEQIETNKHTTNKPSSHSLQIRNFKIVRFKNYIIEKYFFLRRE